MMLDAPKLDVKAARYEHELPQSSLCWRSRTRSPPPTSTLTRREIRLDERQLSQALGVSRTPIREAMTLLEQEGFLRTLPRRGVFIIRKTRREIVEMIQVWAALESMAARLATQRASDTEIATLRTMFAEFQGTRPDEHMDEYSDANIAFHQAIIEDGQLRR